MLKKDITNTSTSTEETVDTSEYVYVDEDSDDNTSNTIGQVFEAIKRAIKRLKDKDGTDYFKSIAVDTGEYERIMSKVNTEKETRFPALYMRMTNIHFLVSQQRIGEGRATLRIRFILNKLDHQKANKENYAFYMAEKINTVIQDAKNTEVALSERCNLQYLDMPETQNMLQAFWIDYEIYFTINSATTYHKYKSVKIFTPPFTNHSDIPDGKIDINPPTYDDSSKIKEIKVAEDTVES